MAQEPCGQDDGLPTDTGCDGHLAETTSGSEQNHGSGEVQPGDSGDKTVVRTVTPRSAYKKIGPDLVSKVAAEYAKYLEKPTPTTRKSYLTWRLRVHLRCNGFLKAQLEAVNESFNLGLNDDEAGPLMWEYEKG